MFCCFIYGIGTLLQNYNLPQLTGLSSQNPTGASSQSPVPQQPYKQGGGQAQPSKQPKHHTHLPNI
jgi:hypothetical protein